MNKLKCLFGFHETKTIGHGGFFSFKITQCNNCESGFQEMDYGPFLKWMTRSKMQADKFKKYLEDHKERSK